MSSVLSRIHCPPPPCCSSIGTCSASCARLSQMHKHMLTHAIAHRDLQANTHPKHTFSAPCLIPATVAMATTLHVWIKHYITPSDSVCGPRSFSILLHLFYSLLLYQNVQSGEEMKMFDMDCTQDGVCTLDLQLLTTAGWLGCSEALEHLWDLEIYCFLWCIEC